jgi:hypothetical protein
MKTLWFGILAVVLSVPAAAFEVIRLDDGTVIRGEVVSQTDSTVTMDSENLGRVTIKRSRIASSPVKDTELLPPRVARRLDADPIGHTLVLMPTAFLPPKGSVVFRDFELIFLTLGYSPTDNTSVVAGAMLPFTSEFNALTVGVKQSLFQKANGAVAVVGNVTVPLGSGIDEAGFLWLLNGVASYRFDDRIGVHAAVGGIGAQGHGEGVSGLSLGAGTDLRLTDHIKVLGEVLHGGTSFDPGSDATLIDFALRIHGERLSADIGGIRPLEDIGNLLFWPLVSIGYRF